MHVFQHSHKLQKKIKRKAFKIIILISYIKVDFLRNNFTESLNLLNVRQLCRSDVAVWLLGLEFLGKFKIVCVVVHT